MITEAILFILLLLFFYLCNRRPSGIPPGIWGWPIIGKLPSPKISLVDQVNKHRETYGDIFSWRIGSRVFIFLCNYDVIKTAMNKIELCDRPAFYSIDMATKFRKIGIVNSCGKVFQANRRFTFRHLKDLGMGKTSYEAVVKDEVFCLVKELEKQADGKPKSLPWSLNVAFLNVIWRIVADHRYDVDDVEIQRFNILVDKLFSDVGSVIALYDLIPWLPKIVPDFVNEWCGVKDFFRFGDSLKEMLQKFIEEHQKTLDPQNPRDYIDFYLIEMEKQKDDPESHREILDLLLSLLDLFVAGSETTASTLRWSILHLAQHPHIQNKAQAELDAVVDKDNLPSLQHRESLPYLEAIMMEVQRYTTLGGLSLPHAASKTTTLNGYTIPKDAVIMTNLESCHRDPNYWEKPDEFYPENFLDNEGKLVSKKEGYLPFSVGKRSCPGESLAVMENFLFLSAVLQKFHFALPEGEQINTTRNPKDRFIHVCKPYNVIIQKR